MTGTPTTSPARPPAPESTHLAPGARVLWRRWRGVLVVALLITMTASIALLISGGARQGSELDPDDTTLTGAKGLAELLREAGVEVVRVSNATAAAAVAGDDSLLLVPHTVRLPPEQFEMLAALPSDRLLVAPAAATRAALAPGVKWTAEAQTRSREPHCALPAATRAGTAHTGGFAMTAPSGATGCYPAADGPTLVSYTSGERTITVVGDGGFMTNLRLGEDGNAALAMNLAGSRGTLIWMVPPDDPGELGALVWPGSRTLYELVPAGVYWALLQLVIAVALVAAWRARRIGPVVVERLPVAVRAAETVEGRGRLYRARRARDRASAALRAGTLHRLVPRLGLTADSGPEVVVATLAGRTGQDSHRVRSALFGPPPADDGGLVALAAYLDTLERQVRDS
ncbi:DUF4350 domain-containing protein [Spongiactinospora gelatinilytica]|uniref:DUF4350 domain-containing protein n=1 Tax=Spongiactinospora gelatinilytica TaxID=2666298 RepID=A0A2W2GF82_9ACTN|nr:DUF4350 domain-containing protein [Spongiactinospora gelatinilytica]PZG25504.1 DUF4350 domain-containing protein [Spongiactinospora gelatinilytica]